MLSKRLRREVPTRIFAQSVFFELPLGQGGKIVSDCSECCSSVDDVTLQCHSHREYVTGSIWDTVIGSRLNRSHGLFVRRYIVRGLVKMGF